MRFGYGLAIAAMLSVAPAYAQQFQPITISPDEYQALITTLMQRDPVIHELIAKQEKAQADRIAQMRQAQEKQTKDQGEVVDRAAAAVK